MTHKETTAHIRRRLQAQGIKARVQMRNACGSDYVSVTVPTFEARFTAEEIRAFCICAKANGLTMVRGGVIDPEHEALLTGKQQWDFYIR